MGAGRFGDRYNATSDILDGAVDRGHGDREAIRTPDRSLTYADLIAASNRFGNALLGLGVAMENRVLVALLDAPEFAAAFFGAIKVGAVPIPVNTNLKAHDYAHLLNDSRAVAAVVSAPLAGALREARPQAPFLKHLIVTGEAGPGEVGFEELTAAASEVLDPAPTTPDDMCFWLYTSGTTGRPKGAVHLQHDMRVCIDNFALPVLGMRETDVTFSVAKLYFAYGLGNALHFPLATGATTILIPGPPSPAAVLETVRTQRPTVYFGVPTSYASLLAAGLLQEGDFSSVRICVSAGEPLSGSILERWQSRTGTDILDAIGSTEVLHCFISNRIGDIRPDCSGTVVPGYEARVVDADGRDLPDGEVGNLMVSGDSICSHYWNQHDRTRRTIIGEWIDTGDKYVRDTDGRFRYQGRTDDMLKVGGIWVSPAEVEAAINAHPAVLECAVVGRAGPGGLVTAEAHVVLQRPGDGSADLADQLRTHVRERLAHFKCPRDFHFVESLPKTATGKIQRFRLRIPEAAAP